MACAVGGHTWQMDFDADLEVGTRCDCGERRWRVRQVALHEWGHDKPIWSGPESDIPREIVIPVKTNLREAHLAPGDVTNTVVTTYSLSTRYMERRTI